MSHGLVFMREIIISSEKERDLLIADHYKKNALPLTGRMFPDGQCAYKAGVSFQVWQGSIQLSARCPIPG